MPRSSLTPDECRQITDAVTDIFSSTVSAVYLFGSLSSGQGHASSDVDLALVTLAKPNAEAVFALKSKIASLLRRDVDVVDLRRADAVTKVQVITTGELLLDHSPVELAAFETTAMSQYALLNEERAGIVADIVARGSIYG